MAWEEAILVGGGPSLRKFPFEHIRGRTTIAINDAMLKLPWATAAFSADCDWVYNRSKELEEFQGERYVAIPRPLQKLVPGVEYLIRGRGAGLSMAWPTVNIHGTSGYGALNLAFLKGAKTVFLLGFDYAQGHQHWYENYPWLTAGTRDNVFQQWAVHFELASQQLKAAGVQVFNACPESLITAFPKVTLKEVIEWPPKLIPAIPPAATETL